MTDALHDAIDTRVPSPQRLSITLNEGDPTRLRKVLLGEPRGPWTDAREDQSTEAGLLSFKAHRAACNGLPAATAVLHRTDDRGAVPGNAYALTNVVPQQRGDRFTLERLNALVDDFDRYVVMPAEHDGWVTVTRSDPYRLLQEWVGEEGVEELARFLLADTASAGLSHPSDAARWYRFLNAALPARREGLTGAIAAVLERAGLAPDTVQGLVRVTEQIEDYERAARERRRERDIAA